MVSVQERAPAIDYMKLLHVPRPILNAVTLLPFIRLWTWSPIWVVFAIFAAGVHAFPSPGRERTVKVAFTPAVLHDAPVWVIILITGLSMGDCVVCTETTRRIGACCGVVRQGWMAFRALCMASWVELAILTVLTLVCHFQRSYRIHESRRSDYGLLHSCEHAQLLVYTAITLSLPLAVRWEIAWGLAVVAMLSLSPINSSAECTFTLGVIILSSTDVCGGAISVGIVAAREVYRHNSWHGPLVVLLTAAMAWDLPHIAIVATMALSALVSPRVWGFAMWIVSVPMTGSLVVSGLLLTVLLTPLASASSRIVLYLPLLVGLCRGANVWDDERVGPALIISIIMGTAVYTFELRRTHRFEQLPTSSASALQPYFDRKCRANRKGSIMTGFGIYFVKPWSDFLDWTLMDWSRITSIIDEIEWSGWEPDLVVGILSGGAFVQSLLPFPNARHASITAKKVWSNRTPLSNLSAVYRVLTNHERWQNQSARDVEWVVHPGSHKPRQILLFDDSVSTGRTMMSLRRFIATTYPTAEVRTGALICPADGVLNVDFVGKYGQVPTRWPWGMETD
jgi:hypoxanthine phosphoribosyltransferase